MNNIIGAETIKTKTQEINQQHPDLPEVETYQEFWNILTNQKNEALYHKIDKNNLDNISIVSDPSNNPNSPETNIYAIQLLQPTTDGDKNIDLCYIRGKRKLEKFLAQYIRHDILHYQKEVQLSINETQESTEAILYTKEEAGVLKGDINDIVSEFEYSKEGVKEYYKQAKDLHNRVTKDYESSYKVIKDRQKKRKKPTLLEETMLSILEHKYNKDIRNIGQIDDTIKHLGKEYRKDLNSDVRQQNTKSNYLQLMYLQTQAQLLSAVLSSQAAQENFVDNPDRYMDIPVESSKDALFLRNAYDTMSKERSKINALLTDANFKNIKDKDNQTLQAYLTSVLEDGNNGQEPFVPSEEYRTEYSKIVDAYPRVQERMNPDVTDKKTGRNKRETPSKKEIEDLTGKKMTESEYNTMQFKYEKPKSRQEKALPQQYLDWIDQSDMKVDTKNRLKNASGFLMVAGLIALGAKTIHSRVKGEKGKLGWTAGLGAVIGLLYVGGGNMNKASKEIASRFGGSENEKKDGSIESIYGAGMIQTNTLFSGMTYRNMNRFIDEENGILKLNYDDMEAYLASNPDKLNNISARKEALKKLKNSDKSNLLHLALSDGLGISKEKLENQNNGDITYESIAIDAIRRIGEINNFMHDNGYVRRNAEGQKQLTKYIKEGKGSLQLLANMGVFEKEVAVVENENLKNQIDQLTTITTEEEKDKLYTYALRVRQELKKDTDYEGSLEFTEKNGKLHLKTYGKETPIDLETKQIGSIPLYTTYQLLKAANLTNRLQDIFAGKTEADEPFNISRPLGRIEFEKRPLLSWENLKFWKGETYEQMFDTSATNMSTLNKIAPSLEDNKQAYVDYLNNLPGRKA